MARSRRKSPRTGGVLRVVGRFVLLVGLGFGIGLVIGLATEEPALLYGHVSGEGEMVAIVEEERILEARDGQEAQEAEPAVEGVEIVQSESDSSADPGAARAVVGAPVRPQAERLALKRETETVKALPKVAARQPVPKPSPGSTSGEGAEAWAIQVGAFSDELAARRLVEMLEAKSYPVDVIVSSGSNQRWRVRVQPVRGEQRARGMADQLKREERLPTWLIRMDAGSR